MLVVFGAITLDMLFPVPAIPGPGDTLRVQGGWAEPGGKAVIQAVAARRDGAHVEVVGAVGRDMLGDAVLAGLARAGVRRRRVARVADPTGRASISVTPDGHSAIVVDEGANRCARAAQVPDRLLGPGHTLLLQMNVPAVETAALILRAKRLGTRVILNLAPARPIATEALRAVDLVIGNRQEIGWLGEHLGTGNNPSSIRRAVGLDTVRMLGVQGAELAWAGGYARIPAYPVDMRDTTTAGDGFVGVLAGALDRGATLPEAMRRAAVAAALSTTRLGAGVSLPDRRETDAAMRIAPEVSHDEPPMPE